MPLKSGDKSFVLITGASRGFGQAIAVRFAALVGPESHFLLLGRDVKGLAATKQLILDQASSKNFTVGAKSRDLVNAKERDFQELFLDQIPAEQFRQLVIVHNAGG